VADDGASWWLKPADGASQLHYGADHTVYCVDSPIINVIKPVDAENLIRHGVSIQHQAVLNPDGDAAWWAIGMKLSDLRSAPVSGMRPTSAVWV
jgi:hypothetical protein